MQFNTLIPTAEDDAFVFFPSPSTKPARHTSRRTQPAKPIIGRAEAQADVIAFKPQD